ncbi:MAG: type II toxin-antitoxin system VapC family toxin [Pirellulales bacterium]
MSDLVVDSSVVAKWILPEADSDKAQQLILQTSDSGDRLIVLDLVFPEVANAIWKRQRQQLIQLHEARELLQALLGSPVAVEPAASLLAPAYEIAAKYDRAVYDASFVALAEQHGVPGITADEPLFNAIHADFPRIILLRDFI